MSLKARIRFDFKAEAPSSHFFWRRHDLREAAKKIRNQKVALLRNLPLQGVNVQGLELDYEVYLVPGEGHNGDAAYAPAELVVEADSPEDLIKLTLKEEFRKIRVLEPQELSLSHNEMERLIFKMSEEYRNEISEFE